MVNFISIGQTCCVKYQIDKCIGEKETLFFDWLMTDMRSVIKVFRHYNNIGNLLYYENIVHNQQNKICEDKSRMLIKSLPLCESYHDIKIDFDDKDIYEFIEKYKRRFERIITFIKENKEHIVFMRYGDIDKKKKEKFIQIIKEINPVCNFTLVTLYKGNNNEKTLHQKRFISININNYLINQDDPQDWTKNYYDWEKMFDDIQQLVIK